MMIGQSAAAGRYAGACMLRTNALAEVQPRPVLCLERHGSTYKVGLHSVYNLSSLNPVINSQYYIKMFVPKDRP